MQLFAGITGVNRLLRVPRLSGAETRLVVSPNHDTTYALAILDLRGEPQALTVPTIDRYYTFQLIDAWMHTVANIGTRATGGAPGTWVIVPPGFDGRLPPGVHRIESPTNQLVILGRVRAVDDADAADAFAATRALQLRPLSALTGARAAPPPPPMPKPVGTPQDVGGNGLGYFDELGEALTVNPPVDGERRRVLRRAERLGVGAGRRPSRSASGARRRALTKAVAAGMVTVADTTALDGRIVNGWEVLLGLGDQNGPEDLTRRAVIARNYWGPNVAAESVYPLLRTASDGQALTGAKDYVIHLGADDLPPVDAFWSYTVYGPDRFLVANSIDRYAISGDTPGLVRNADRSIDVYLSHRPPAGHGANWLPTPAGDYRLIMRLYLPGPAVLDGTYRYPPVEVAS